MKSLAELKAIKEKMQGQVGMRTGEDDNGIRIHVGMATCGIAAGARPVLTTLSDLVQANNIEGVKVVQTGCVGLCQYEPIVEIEEPGKEKTTYVKMDAEKAKEVFEQHIQRGQVLAKYTINTTDLAKR
jgi:NADP-reducing hydrogenase subunit HndB